MVKRQTEENILIKLSKEEESTIVGGGYHGHYGHGHYGHGHYGHGHHRYDGYYGHHYYPYY